MLTKFVIDIFCFHLFSLKPCVLLGSSKVSYAESVPEEKFGNKYASADHITLNFLKAVFYKFYLVHS